jgi:hypothetical protein
MTETGTKHEAARLAEEQTDHLLLQFSRGLATTDQVRAPVLHNPS